MWLAGTRAGRPDEAGEECSEEGGKEGQEHMVRLFAGQPKERPISRRPVVEAKPTPKRVVMWKAITGG